MDKDFKRGIKLSLGFIITTMGIIGLAFAAGDMWHYAEDIVGGTFLEDYIFNGTVTLNNEPTQPSHAATKQYVDTQSGTSSDVINEEKYYSIGIFAGAKIKCSSIIINENDFKCWRPKATYVINSTTTKEGLIFDGIRNAKSVCLALNGDYVSHTYWLPVSGTQMSISNNQEGNYNNPRWSITEAGQTAWASLQEITCNK